MRLWTLQPACVLNELENTGTFICDITKTENTEDCFKDAYNWLVIEMEKRIGKKPPNVSYPIWAWHTTNWKHKKPDLRHFAYASSVKKGEKYACIEIEVPDEEVVLSDFDAWHYVLNKWFLDDSTNEEEWDESHEWYDSLPMYEKENVLKESWQKIFDISPLDSTWKLRGYYIQATFWEFKKEYIKKVQFYTTR